MREQLLTDATGHRLHFDVCHNVTAQLILAGIDATTDVTGQLLVVSALVCVQVWFEHEASVTDVALMWPLACVAKHVCSHIRVR